MKKILTGIKILSTLALVLFLSGCNKDKEGVSPEQIRQALFDMKGTYHGTTEVSYFHGSEIAEIDETKAVSRDSLSFVIPLGPIADMMGDEKIAAALRAVEKAEVKAGYHFSQIDDNGYFVSFGLSPKNIIIPAQGDVPGITIVLADVFGGSFHKGQNFIMFNVSPEEVLVNGTKVDSFKQLVYHFDGVYE